MKRTILTVALQLILCIWMNAQNANLGTGAGNSGTDNTSAGAYAGDLVTGSYNAFLGAYSGKNCTSCNYNVIAGYQSAYNVNLGSNNVYLGYKAAYSTSASTSSDNVFIGYQTGYSLSGSGGANIFVGRSAGYGNTNGARNIFIGYNSGYSSGTTIDNIGLGYKSGYNNSTGQNNLFLGANSGFSNVSGSSNVFIGANAGYNETGSNKLYIDNSNTTTPLVYGDFSLNQVGINILPNTTHTLTVGGTIHATGIFVNGVPMSGDMSLWNRNGSNVNTDNVTDNIGIGVVLTATNNPNNYRLAVKGKIGAQEVQIENTSITWSDFVFYDDYKLRSLEEVEAFIKTNGHLPEIPSEKQVKEEGIKLAEMNAKLLQKIEELTLYVIELKKEVDAMKKTQE